MSPSSLEVLIEMYKEKLNLVSWGIWRLCEGHVPHCGRAGGCSRQTSLVGGEANGLEVVLGEPASLEAKRMGWRWHGTSGPHWRRSEQAGGGGG